MVFLGVKHMKKTMLYSLYFGIFAVGQTSFASDDVGTKIDERRMRMVAAWVKKVEEAYCFLPLCDSRDGQPCEHDMCIQWNSAEERHLAVDHAVMVQAERGAIVSSSGDTVVIKEPRKLKWKLPRFLRKRKKLDDKRK